MGALRIDGMPQADINLEPSGGRATITSQATFYRLLTSKVGINDVLAKLEMPSLTDFFFINRLCNGYLPATAGAPVRPRRTWTTLISAIFGLVTRRKVAGIILLLRY